MNRIKRLLPLWGIITVLIFALFAVPLLAQEGQGLQLESKVLKKEQNAVGGDTRVIEFVGRPWLVKSGCGLGPGPNCWSDSEESVWVDESGQLHLKIRKSEETWYSAEVYSKSCTQYGMHRFFMIGRLDNLDQNVIASPFLYQDDEAEIDIEFAKWGLENSPNTQYSVQPWETLGNQEEFSMTLSGKNTTHYIDWSASEIHFKSIHGHYEEPPTAEYLIHEWSYTGDDIPAEEKCLRIHINLWLNEGMPPSDGQEVELIVQNAQFLPSRDEIYLPLILKPAP